MDYWSVFGDFVGNGNLNTYGSNLLGVYGVKAEFFSFTL